MLMYTSCGWFFDEVSGIEASQVIQYAGRVIQLAADALGDDLEHEFLSRLELAKGNIPERPDARQVYLKVVKPSAVDLVRVGAHYAVMSLFQDYPDTARVYCYDVARTGLDVRTAGRARLAMGRAQVTSRITLESAELTYGVLHLGDQVLNAGVRRSSESGDYDVLLRDARGAFERADFPQIIRAMDHAFGSVAYSIASLFRDEQHKIVQRILEPALEQADALFLQIHEQHAPLVRYLRQLDLYIPRRLLTAAGFVINSEMRAALSADQPDFGRIDQLLDEARHEGVSLDGPILGFALVRTLDRLVSRVSASTPVDDLLTLERVVQLAHRLPFDVDLWQFHKSYFSLMRSVRPPAAERASAGDEEAARWVKAFDALGAALRVRVS
jgi:hypothetical protein